MFFSFFFLRLFVHTYFHGSRFSIAVDVVIAIAFVLVVVIVIFFSFFSFVIQIEVKSLFLKTIATKGNERCRREERSQFVLIKTPSCEVTCYLYVLTFSNFKTWLNMASSLHADAAVHRARERERASERKGTYTLDRQYQIIVKSERMREDGTKLNFFLSSLP